MKRELKIKVCGMRDEENIRQLCELPIHYIGFIFYPPSPRYAGDMPVTAIRNVPAHISKVGVFVNADNATIRAAIEKYDLNIVQLHGNELPDFCHNLKSMGIPVIKSIPASNLTSNQLTAYSQACDYLLFDTPTALYGGSGQKFNWNEIEGINIPLPFFLSGGLSPNDANEVMAFSHPQFFAIDLNSKFETRPGYKNIGLLKTFIQSL
jgi:phosphoribosylanthranilate isomerase